VARLLVPELPHTGIEGRVTMREDQPQLGGAARDCNLRAGGSRLEEFRWQRQ
jgi:hypothetical protein